MLNLVCKIIKGPTSVSKVPIMSISILLFLSIVLPILPLIFFVFKSKKPETLSYLPKSYPLIGHFPALLANCNRQSQWLSEILQNSPSATVILHHPFGRRAVDTANPANVHHILKTHFHLYPKGRHSRSILSDFLGDGIFNADGETWKFQRQIASHEFSTRSLRKFVETAVDFELSERLIPILSSATQNGAVLDFQDVLQRFAFDNICKIAFGFDPAYLSPSMPEAQFAQAFEDSVKISSYRFQSLIWKIKRALNIGSEKKLRESVSQVRDFTLKLIKEKKEELQKNSSTESVDLLSRFLTFGHSDETFVADIVISFILAGRDTTSAALTWYFWLLHKNPEIQSKVVAEIQGKSENPDYEEVKEMIYTHASLCESMRLYPPVPADTKYAEGDDVLPDGTPVRKGMTVTYHPYAMGRLEMIWGEDWTDYRPERWLERDLVNGKWKFVGKDAYNYPVFQAGPRVCLGKEMAFLQMKRVVAGVIGRFKVVPAESGVEPEFVSYLTAKMSGGYPVRIEQRNT